MSLTSNLNRSDSEIRQFFAKHLPKLRTASRQINKQFAGCELRADSSRLTRYEKAVAGGAIDYRIRMLFDSEYDWEFIAVGATVMGKQWARRNGIYEKLLAYLSQTTDERRLCQISIIFAYLDGCFRSGLESTTLKEIGSPQLEQMLDSLNPALGSGLITSS
jgi:hypothetical protein